MYEMLSKFHNFDATHMHVILVLRYTVAITTNNIKNSSANHN